MILGLDVSTSITGVTVLHDEQIVYCEAWDYRNKKLYPSLLTKASETKRRLRELKKNFDIKNIYIEKNLQSFRSGFSSAKTLSTLSAFNGIVSWLCYEVFSKEPETISALSARRMCGIKIPKGEKAKPVVLKYLLDNEPSFSIEYTKFGNPKPGEYDRADSIVIARAGYQFCQNSRK